MDSGEGTIAVKDGTRLYFRMAGGGRGTILIPNGLYLMEDFRRLSDGRRMIFYDVRNRGKSETVGDPAKLARGIAQDVDDLDEVRRHFGAEPVHVMGHSYMGLMVALYGMKYGTHVGRVVQIGPAAPDPSKQYPPELTGADAVLAEVMAELGRMAKEPPSGDAEAMCRKFSSVLRRICVVDAANVERIDWGRCELANERNFMQYWMGYLQPSIQRLQLAPEDFAKVTAPVLVVHGRKDRNAPYGGARDWAAHLPNVRLVTVENAAHAPWIEAPELVFGAIERFLDGAWPEAAEIVNGISPPPAN